MLNSRSVTAHRSRPNSGNRDKASGRLGMNVLVTGGAGFLGSHLCDQLLASGHSVICLDNFVTGSRRNLASALTHPRFRLVERDVTRPIDASVLGGNRIDRIFHMACPASPPRYQSDPVATLRTAVCGSENMLQLAREQRARVLLASTSEVYGDPEQHPQRESYWGNVNPIGARACYDEGKRCAEALATCYAQQFGVAVRIARIFNTYGPRMDERDGRVVSNFIVQALAGEPLTIYGSGRQTRSFCYVNDLIEGLLLLMEHDEALGPVNLGNPEELTVQALAHEILRLTGSDSPLRHQPLPADDPRRRKPDIAKATSTLGWRPRTSVNQGLAATIAAFRDLGQRERQDERALEQPRAYHE